MRAQEPYDANVAPQRRPHFRHIITMTLRVSDVVPCSRAHTSDDCAFCLFTAANRGGEVEDILEAEDIDCGCGRSELCIANDPHYHQHLWIINVSSVGVCHWLSLILVLFNFHLSPTLSPPPGAPWSTGDCSDLRTDVI